MRLHSFNTPPKKYLTPGSMRVGDDAFWDAWLGIVLCIARFDIARFDIARFDIAIYIMPLKIQINLYTMFILCISPTNQHKQ